MWWTKEYGELRVVHLGDGHRVVGRGLSIAVDSRAEGEQVIRDLIAPSSTAGTSR